MIIRHEPTATFCALAYLHGRDGRVTVRDIAELRGRAVASVLKDLRALERLGLIDGLGIPGALRPAVRPVAGKWAA